MKQTIKMDWVKDTKNTSVYKTDDISAPVTQVYVQKTALDGDAPPMVITLTIEAEV